MQKQMSVMMNSGTTAATAAITEVDEDLLESWVAPACCEKQNKHKLYLVFYIKCEDLSNNIEDF